MRGSDSPCQGLSPDESARARGAAVLEEKTAPERAVRREYEFDDDDDDDDEASRGGLRYEPFTPRKPLWLPAFLHVDHNGRPKKAP